MVTTQPVSTDGRQRSARHARLQHLIIEYVGKHPGCSANQIVAGLCSMKGMKSHALTPRKIGFFIPRHCGEAVSFVVDGSTGKRIYYPSGA